MTCRIRRGWCSPRKNRCTRDSRRRTPRRIGRRRTWPHRSPVAGRRSHSCHSSGRCSAGSRSSCRSAFGRGDSRSYTRTPPHPSRRAAWPQHRRWRTRRSAPAPRGPPRSRSRRCRHLDHRSPRGSLGTPSRSACHRSWRAYSAARGRARTQRHTSPYPCCASTRRRTGASPDRSRCRTLRHRTCSIRRAALGTPCRRCHNRADHRPRRRRHRSRGSPLGTSTRRPPVGKSHRRFRALGKVRRMSRR